MSVPTVFSIPTDTDALRISPMMRPRPDPAKTKRPQAPADRTVRRPAIDGCRHRFGPAKAELSFVRVLGGPPDHRFAKKSSRPLAERHPTASPRPCVFPTCTTTPFPIRRYLRTPQPMPRLLRSPCSPVTRDGPTTPLPTFEVPPTRTNSTHRRRSECRPEPDTASVAVRLTQTNSSDISPAALLVRINLSPMSSCLRGSLPRFPSFSRSQSAPPVRDSTTTPLPTVRVPTETRRHSCRLFFRADKPVRHLTGCEDRCRRSHRPPVATQGPARGSPTTPPPTLRVPAILDDTPHRPRFSHKYPVRHSVGHAFRTGSGKRRADRSTAPRRPKPAAKNESLHRYGQPVPPFRDRPPLSEKIARKASVFFGHQHRYAGKPSRLADTCRPRNGKVDSHFPRPGSVTESSMSRRSKCTKRSTKHR